MIVSKTGKALQRRQKENSKLAREIFSPGPKWDLPSEVWGLHAPSLYLHRKSASAKRKLAHATVQLWRTERRFRLGSHLAICDAIEICREHEWPFPAWLQEYLVANFSTALFYSTKFQAGLPRIRQSELTRVQTQKHVQIVWVIKNWKSLTKDGFASADPATLVRHPWEVADLPDSWFETTANESNRANLASRIFKRCKFEYRSSSPENIESSLKEINQSVSDLFGTSMGIDFEPQHYLWDAPFLHPNTLKLVNYF